MSVAQSKDSPDLMYPHVIEVPAGKGVPFPGNNDPGESEKQSSCLSWLQTHPSVDFHLLHLPFKKEKPEKGGVLWESSLGHWVRVCGGL